MAHMEKQATPNKRTIWHGIIGTGQSLSCGFGGPILQDTIAAPAALKLQDNQNKYDITKPDSSSLEVVPLTEPLRALQGTVLQYPRNIAGMTPHNSLAKTLHMSRESQGNGDHHVTVHICVGQGGAPMDVIEENGYGNSYAASIFEAKALNRIAIQQGAELVFDAVLLTHGESDAANGNPDYAKRVLSMQVDYAADLMAITGQEKEPVLILSQQNTCPTVPDLNPDLIDDMWRVQNVSDGKVICSGPKYQFHYVDGLHLPVGGYNRLGEKYGQTLAEVLKEGRPFRPLSPQKAQALSSKIVDVKFHVPQPPLQWDENLPSPHQHYQHAAFRRGRGFEVRDADGAELEIEAVTIQPDGESVSIELSNPVRRWPLKIAYAMVQDGPEIGTGVRGGTADGRMGHLCDNADAQLRDQVECHVQNNSRTIECAAGWVARAVYDILEPGNLVIVELNPSTPLKAILSKAWSGPSGLVQMGIRHNQRNYCVSFKLSVEKTF